MKKLILGLVLIGAAASGVALAGGTDGAIVKLRQLVLEGRLLSPAPPSTKPQRTTPPRAAAPAVATPPTPAAPKARILRSADDRPREQLSDEDRARLNRIIEERLGPRQQPVHKDS